MSAQLQPPAPIIFANHPHALRLHNLTHYMPPNLRKPSERVVLAQSTHSSIKFTITVGADLYIRPNAPYLHNPNRLRHQIYATTLTRHTYTTPTTRAIKFTQPP